MRSKTAAVGLVVAVTAALATSVAAHPGASGAPTLSLLAVGETFDMVDNGEDGLGVGDVFASGGSVYRWHGRGRGPRVGHVDVLCTALTGDGARSHCAITLAVREGRIEAVGLFTGESNTFAVTGGTRRYRDTRGELTIRPLGGDRLALVYRFGPDNS